MIARTIIIVQNLPSHLFTTIFLMLFTFRALFECCPTCFHKKIVGFQVLL
jgi:hypothetical protein